MLYFVKEWKKNAYLECLNVSSYDGNALVLLRSLKLSVIISVEHVICIFSSAWAATLSHYAKVVHNEVVHLPRGVPVDCWDSTMLN